MDQPKKLSQEPQATTLGENDRFAILYQANTNTPSLRTISSNNVMRTMFAGLPIYATNAQALANSEPIGSMYVTLSGVVMIVHG
jgi:hypothetical protein